MPSKKMLSSKLEVLVDFGGDNKSIDTTLNKLQETDGVNNAQFKNGSILVETTLPSSQILELVTQTSGKRAVLQGFGETQSAVAIVSSQGCGRTNIMGVIRFQQTDSASLIADGTVDGLAPGQHGLHIHESGDLSQGCRSLGGHYNPRGAPHGGPRGAPGARHAGDLGNIEADGSGRARFRIEDGLLKVSDIIGRSVGITERKDDLGLGSVPTSKIDGNSGEVIACGIIARAAGVFQNEKRVCACDGVVVWDERDRPLAGKGRRQPCCGGGDSGGGKPCCKV